MQLFNLPNWVSKLPVIKKYRLSGKDLNQKNNGKAGNFVQIIREATDKSRKGNEDWRNALQMADAVENPKWNLLQDIFDYLIIDPHTHSLIELRQAATLGSRFYVYDKKTGQEQPQKTTLLQTEWFYTLLTKALESRKRGYMLAWLANPATMEFSYIPHRNIVPNKDIVLAKTSDDTGFDLTNPSFKNWMIYVKDDYLYGYMNDLVPLILWKINALQSWAEATEKYGIPPLIATTTKSDDKSLGKLMDMLKSIGESLVAALPDGTKVQVMENAEKVDPAKMFGAFVTLCDEQISKRIVGGTMITDNGSSHSQSEVHNDNFDKKIIESDKRKIEFIVTGQLIPMLQQFGYGFTENDAFAFDRSQQISLKDLFEIVKGIIESGYDVDVEWMKKMFQVPIIGKTQKTGTDNSFKQGTTALAAALVPYGVMLPNYNTEGCCNHAPTASFTDNLLAELADELINDVWQGNPTLLNEVLRSIKTYNTLLDGLTDGWGERFMQITYDATDNHCYAAMELNLFNFSRLKEKANVFALNQLLNKGKDTMVFKNFRDKALKYLKNPDINWLKTEFNHAIAVGQNASRYHQFKSEENTVTQWVQWQTVGDDRVRAKHAALNGKVFNLKEKGGLNCWPPKEHGCRCELTQYLGKPPTAERLSNADALKLLGIEDDNNWNVNRGDVEQVFTANQMYMQEKNLTNETNNLLYSNYGLKNFDEVKSKYKSISIDETITKENVQELFVKEDKQTYMGFTDYRGRKMIMSAETFNTHTQTAKYVKEGRHQLFAQVKDVLAKPDEVYLFKRATGNYQTNYIKFYKDRALVVNTRLGATQIEINTWYEMKQEEAVRKGYLIYTNKKP